MDLLLCGHALRLSCIVHLNRLPSQGQGEDCYSFRVSHVPVTCVIGFDTLQFPEAFEDVSHLLIMIATSLTPDKNVV